ncbi:carboxypeptidase regulatory-like domain-containing protein [Ramlibacter sp. XY19]|uniref:carboxypeptidase regulatory-like domain-containing protein n=1 Tax=Ramlibacter paludis TaxID=2908000 RepID=UPI0023DA14C8|nr:carboxypeptidase regulatory-like domain-containing protein [Ramlibacter paludis]MCG2591525.1 carboxypeptidase regulatory-like domain-containing protein [Ramlibacter paludis]
MKKRFLALPALALALACGMAQAQTFRCGGIGTAEQDQFKAEASQHDALLTFALSTGAYVSDVDVTVTDGRGKTVVQGRCGGPLMLLDLPGKGTYRVNASYEGKAQSKSLSLGAKPARAVFTWPAG